MGCRRPALRECRLGLKADSHFLIRGPGCGWDAGTAEEGDFSRAADPAPILWAPWPRVVRGPWRRRPAASCVFGDPPSATTSALSAAYPEPYDLEAGLRGTPAQVPVDLGFSLGASFRCRLALSGGLQMVRAREAGCLEEEDT